MSELTDLIERISSGKISVTNAVPDFLKIVVTKDTGPAVKVPRDEYDRMLVDKDDTNTFTEVTSAYFNNQLSKEQYSVLRQALIDHTGASGG